MWKGSPDAGVSIAKFNILTERQKDIKIRVFVFMSLCLYVFLSTIYLEVVNERDGDAGLRGGN